MARKAKRPPRKPRLLIVFDTNVLYTGAASDLVRKEIAELVRENTGHGDLEIEWYLPHVVLNERAYQMITKGLELLPPIGKLERLLGHNLNITEDIVRQRVMDAIERQSRELGLRELDLDVSSIEWERVVHNAVYRVAPFEAGDKEKGFRDAMVLESVIQLMEASPRTPQQCRVVFVSGDQTLAEAVTTRSADYRNVRVLSSVDELKGYINTLVADVTEEFVAEIAEPAATLFFLKNDPATLFYREGVKERIRSEFSDELSKVPRAGLQRKEGKWRISSPQFDRKERQRVYWTSRVTVTARLLDPARATIDLMEVLKASLRRSESSAASALGRPGRTAGIPAAAGALAQASPLPLGKSSFSVRWSVSVTTRGVLSRPRIEDIEFVETVWGEP